LRRFLRLGAVSPQPAPSGLAGLDHRLAGGFGPGLHLLRGLPGVGKTAFLESVAWEAISRRRPVLYYSLRDGDLGAWERLITTLGSLLDMPPVPLDAVRTRTLPPRDLETLRRLDLSLQASVLPYLSLVEHVPASADPLSALIADVRSRVREANDRHGSIPILLIDDLEHLLLAGQARPLPLALSRLDKALAAESMPGLLATTTSLPSSADPETLPVRTVLVLTSVSRSPDEALERIDLDLQTRPAVGPTETLSLLLDHRSGLFAETSTPTEPDAG